LVLNCKRAEILENTRNLWGQTLGFFSPYSLSTGEVVGISMATYYRGFSNPSPSQKQHWRCLSIPLANHRVELRFCLCFALNSDGVTRKPTIPMRSEV